LAEQDSRARKFSDRRLGSSWYEWDGDIESHESALNESPLLYFLLLFFLLVVVTQVLVLDAWVLTQFVFSSWPIATVAVILVIGAPLVVWWHAYLFCLLAVWSRSRYLAFPWFSRWLTLQVPFLSVCAKPFGVSRDRISSSCIAITNTLARLQLRTLSAVRPLILLPRCIRPDVIREVRRLGEEWECPVAVVGANRLAREKVREFRPTAILAVACERDLVSGLYDFGHKMPILVQANTRPTGPCVGATIDLDQIRIALQDIYGLAQEADCPRVKAPKCVSEAD